MIPVTHHHHIPTVPHPSQVYINGFILPEQIQNNTLSQALEGHQVTFPHGIIACYSPNKCGFECNEFFMKLIICTHLSLSLSVCIEQGLSQKGFRFWAFLITQSRAVNTMTGH